MKVASRERDQTNGSFEGGGDCNGESKPVDDTPNPRKSERAVGLAIQGSEHVGVLVDIQLPHLLPCAVVTR